MLPVENSVKCAFKLGYITSLLEYELRNSTNFLSKSSLSNENRYSPIEYLTPFSDDFYKVFKEKLEIPISFPSQYNAQEFLHAQLELIKEKVTELETELELSFFAGGAIAICFADDIGIFSDEKISSVMTLVFDWCNVYQYRNLKDDLSKIFSDDFYECMFARYEICSALIGSEITVEQRAVFNSLDRAIVHKD